MPKLIEVYRSQDKAQPNGYVQNGVLYYYETVWGKNPAPGAQFKSFALPDEGDFGAIPAPVELMKWADGLAYGRPVALYHRGNGDGSYSMIAAVLGKLAGSQPAPPPAQPGGIVLPTINPDKSVQFGAVNLGGVASDVQGAVAAIGADGALYLRQTRDGVNFAPWQRVKPF